MSLINKVLRDLDQRHAIPRGTENAKVQVVDASGKPGGGHEMFWRLVALLVLGALGWVAWVVYQIQPRPLATELAERAAEQRMRKPPVIAQAALAPQAPAPTPATPPPQAETPAPPPAAVAESPKAAPPPVEMLKLAPAIETPIGEPAKQAASEPEKPKPAAKAKPAPAEKQAPIARSEKPRVERRDRVLSVEERAETEFRRGVDLLKRGRAKEAEAAFAASLAADPRHRGARQALVALAFEQQQLDYARRLLADGLAADPAQPDFAVALARIHVEQGDLDAALTAMQPTAPSAGDHADFHLLRGAILQRLGRAGQAAEAYRSALRVQTKLPQAWIGLGISLEALEKRPEAAEAFKRALAAGPVSTDVRTFAEQRIRALR